MSAQGNRLRIRNRRLADALDLLPEIRTLSGLEVGPLDLPMLDKREYDVRYIDYFDADSLRQKAAREASRDADAVVDLDYVLGGSRISEVVDRQFDFVMASHVLEHIPDLVGWLADMDAVLNKAGWIVAFLPDFRYCFDLERSSTTVGTLVENHYLKRTRPSPAMAFDQRFYHKSVRPRELWKDYEGHRESTPRSNTAQRAMDAFRKATERYHDCHCNLFTPASLVEATDATRELGLQPFSVSRLTPARFPFQDFAVLLCR